MFKGFEKIKSKDIRKGSCSFTPGKRPLEKRVMKNTYVITGLGGYGYTLGPALAKEVTDKIIENY